MPSISLELYPKPIKQDKLKGASIFVSESPFFMIISPSKRFIGKINNGIAIKITARQKTNKGFLNKNCIIKQNYANSTNFGNFALEISKINDA